MSAAHDCDVLVVGAGPTGLMAADLLARSGVAVRLVDQREEASRESRAFAVMARSMELLAQLGLAETFLDTGVLNPNVEIFIKGSRAGQFEYDRAAAPDTPYRFITLHPQSRTEKVLLEDLTRLGIEVERRTTVKTLEQDADGVTVVAQDGDGRERRLRSAYVIGADGAHSAVRKALGLTFAGARYPQTFMLADCRVQWPADPLLDHARFRIFVNGATLALFLPLDGARLSRVMAIEANDPGSAGEATESLHLDLPQLESAFRQATGLGVRLDAPVWATRYRSSHHGVDRYGEGRVFVAGDAAHIHSPAGGQGMNTGLQDAANLAWKLAAVLRGADAALLDTYDAERLPVGRQVVATTDRMFATAAGQSGWEASLRDWIARPVAAAMSRSNAVQTALFRRLAQIDIAYAANPFLDDAAPGGKGPKVGQRAPDAAISRDRDVFALLAGYGFTVLALSRKPLETSQVRQLADRLDALSNRHVTAHLVTRMAVGRDPRAIAAISGEVFATYGLHERDAQAIYLIRPDGYIAWRCAGLDIDACAKALARFR